MSNLWRGGKILLVLAVVGVLLSGCEFTYDSYTIDCTGFAIHLTSGRLTIDNSGSGDEIIGVRAVDGAGRSLFYRPDWRTESVGSLFRAGYTDSFTWDFAPSYNPITVAYFNPAGGVLTQELEIGSFTGECSGLPIYIPSHIGVDDGRLNRLDRAAPIAVFPIDYGTGTGLHIYAIAADGTGSLALEVTPEMISAVPNPPAENTLVAATPDGSIVLYRLTTGEFQINAGTYVIVFGDLISTADYYTP